MKTEKTNLLVTSENMEQVKEILEQAGYEPKLIDYGKEGVDVRIKKTLKYADLNYDDYQGFYISTTATWLSDEESIETFSKNLTLAKETIVKINRILDV